MTERDRERQRETGRDRERQRETERDRAGQTETEKDRERQKETEKDRDREFIVICCANLKSLYNEDKDVSKKIWFQTSEYGILATILFFPKVSMVAI